MIKTAIKEVITNACLIVLPADLLYLYFAGEWTDPNKYILTVELIVLPLILIFGVWRTVRFLNRVFLPEKEG